jgi:hypothetical protein
LAIATWADTLSSRAGFDSYKSTWLAGLVNTFGVVGTAAAVSYYPHKALFNID